MRWTLVLERKTKHKLNVDITGKKLRRIAASVERNQALKFAGRPGRLREPERVFDEATGEELWRYLVRLRVEKDDASVRDPAAAERQFQHVLGVLTRCAESEGWAVLPDGPGLAKAEPTLA